MYRYTEPTPVKTRDKVEVLLDESTEWIEGTVGEALATQFTCVYGKGKDKHMSYFFYTDKGETWREV